MTKTVYNLIVLNILAVIAILFFVNFEVFGKSPTIKSERCLQEKTPQDWQKCTHNDDCFLIQRCCGCHVSYNKKFQAEVNSWFEYCPCSGSCDASCKPRELVSCENNLCVNKPSFK